MMSIIENIRLRDIQCSRIYIYIYAYDMVSKAYIITWAKFEM